VTKTGYDHARNAGLEVHPRSFLISAIVPLGEILVAVGLGSPISHMPTISADADIASDVSDIRDLLLGTEDSIDDVEYQHIMWRLGIAEGGPETSVSAFNSSI
jgi:hypothetical protein